MIEIKICDSANSSCENCTNNFCLKNVPLLSNMTEEQLLEISRGTVRKNYKKGQLLFSQGDIANKLYIICSGKVKIFRYTPDGKEQIIYILSPCDFSFIGAFNLLKEDEFDFYAETLEDSVICTLDKKDFDDIITKNPNIMLKILEEAYDRINKVESLVDRLSTNNVEAKVSGLLISLAKDFGTETDDGILLNLTMNREEMASYTGITRETLSRKLRSLHSDGLIEIIGTKKILIKDLERLKDLVY